MKENGQRLVKLMYHIWTSCEKYGSPLCARKSKVSVDKIDTYWYSVHNLCKLAGTIIRDKNSRASIILRDNVEGSSKETCGNNLHRLRETDCMTTKIVNRVITAKENVANNPKRTTGEIDVHTGES